MRRYINYFKYVIVHKWYVFIYCCKQGLFWRGIVHDLDKFYPFMFIAYANNFYEKDGSKREFTRPNNKDLFGKAWLGHTRRNRHHWQYYVLATSKGEKVFPMPLNDIIEMLCDWKGANKVQGYDNVIMWWISNKKFIRLHKDTEFIVNKIIRYI